MSAWKKLHKLMLTSRQTAKTAVGWLRAGDAGSKTGGQVAGG